MVHISILSRIYICSPRRLMSFLEKKISACVGHLCSRNNRVRLLRGIQFTGITADRSERFDIPFGCDGNSPESKKNQIYKANEIGRYALYHRRTVFLVSRSSSLKDAANIANIIPFFRVINELRFFLLRWESKHANNRIQSKISAFYERKLSEITTITVYRTISVNTWPRYAHI